MTAAQDAPVTVLSGGVGAARFLRGLIAAVADPATVTTIVNTGDDCQLHGLSISPDLDTITYTLAGAIDPERGWGLVDESWRAIEALDRYAAVRPPGSSAGDRWFNLGDRDLATHMYRTARLAEGATLTTVTDEIRRAWDVPITILPMSDDRRETRIRTTTEGELAFQEYFVRLRHAVPVEAVEFVGDAVLTTAGRHALEDAAVVVIAPSNPLVSIGPIRSLPGVDTVLGTRRDSVVAVSPIVGGAALKGPADRMMTELGHDSSVVGVARMYAPIAGALIVDPVDAELAPAIEAEGLRCVVTPSVMSTPDVARTLAAVALAAAQ